MVSKVFEIHVWLVSIFKITQMVLLKLLFVIEFPITPNS